MKGKLRDKPRTDGGIIIQFNLVGLIVFTISLVLAVGFLAYNFAHAHTTLADGGNSTRAATAAVLTNRDADLPPKETPAWGEVLTSDIELEPPEEYLAFELGKTWTVTWTFEGKTPDAVRAFLLASGLSAGDADRLLAPAAVSAGAGVTIVRPDDDVVFSLSPETRSKIYTELARSSANGPFVRFPFNFPDRSFDTIFSDGQVSAPVVAMMRTLLYSRGGVLRFSDYELMLRRVPEPERLPWLKSLSRQSAVLPRLRVRPDTDVDKLLGYWGKGIQVKDVRPLLESLKRRPEGGSLSLLYLLPQFARQRLYTFPVDSKSGDPGMDCHWSTMNFFNEVPDDRFSNPAFTSGFIRTNLYEVARPTLYGDVILFLDERNMAVHSAVYLADDLVFTKNGNNSAQPWMLMHLKDLVAKYEPDTPSRVAVYRSKDR